MKKDINDSQLSKPQKINPGIYKNRIIWKQVGLPGLYPKIGRNTVKPDGLAGMSY